MIALRTLTGRLNRLARGWPFFDGELHFIPMDGRQKEVPGKNRLPATMGESHHRIGV